MRLRRPSALAAAVACLALPGQAGAAREMAVVEAPGPAFPSRSMIVTLPERLELTAEQVHVTENGQPVGGLEVQSSAVAGSVVVLAIDASNSMHGRAIRDAMAAARRFAERRRSDQKLGIVFFRRTPTVALQPTDDPNAIAAALAAPPSLSKGTRIRDAVKTSLDVLKGAGARVSTIVVLSDGADVGSTTTLEQIESQARTQNVRLYTVGLRSSSFDATSLEELAIRGDYTEAASSKQLSGIFATLGEQISNEYLISYRSESPLDTRVAVTVSVDGIRETAAMAYETPHLDLDIGDPRRATGSVWARPGTGLAIAVVAALLLAMAVLMLLHPRRVSVRLRVRRYAGLSDEHEEPVTIQLTQRTPTLEVADRSLARSRVWQAWTLDVELARIRFAAVRLAAASIGVALVGALLFGVVLGRPFLGVLALLLIPVVVRVGVKMKADRVRQAFGDQLPDNLQVLASALRAGHSFVGALKVMAEDAAEPSRGEFRRVVADDQLGVSVEDSLGVVGERMKNAEVAYIGLISTIQRETGGNTAEVLDRVTGTIRERAQLRRLVSTLTAQGRLGGWIVTLLPLGMIAFLTLLRPDYMDPLLQSSVGVIALGVGALLLVSGAFIIRKIVDIQV